MAQRSRHLGPRGTRDEVRRGPDVAVASMPARIAALQRSAGNHAVTTALHAQVQRQGTSATGSLAVQRVELGVDYVVTGHGWDRINGRGISQTQLERTLDNPTVIHDDGNSQIYVSAFAGGSVCIRAVMSKDHPMAVITVMKITGKKKVARYVDRP